MIRLIRAEFLKLRTTQVWFWLLLATVAIASAFVIGGIASNSVHNSHDLAETFTGTRVAAIAVFVLGVLAVTTEFRYQTISPTVLVCSRSRPSSGIRRSPRPCCKRLRAGWWSAQSC